MRPSSVSARAACASCAFSSASSTETSSATSTVPASTISPGRRASPGAPCRRTSLRSVIERSASTVPIDVVVARCSRSVATATVTASIGSGWLAAAASASWTDAYFHAARPPPVRDDSHEQQKGPIQLRRFPRGALAESRSRVGSLYRLPVSVIPFHVVSAHSSSHTKTNETGQNRQLASPPRQLFPISQRVPQGRACRPKRSNGCKERELGVEGALAGGADEVSDIRQVSEDGQRCSGIEIRGARPVRDPAVRDHPPRRQWLLQGYHSSDNLSLATVGEEVSWRELRTSRPLFKIRIELHPLQEVGGTPLGQRRVVPVSRRNFRRRAPPWARAGHTPEATGCSAARTAPSQQDVRLTLETDDGALILMSYRGVRHSSPEVAARIARGEQVEAHEYYLRTAPFFETGASQYAWLNTIVSVGVGERLPNGATYEVFEIL